MLRRLFGLLGRYLGITFLLITGGAYGAPLAFKWGQPHWVSSTQLRLPLVVTLQKGWKCYGPPQKGDTLQRPLEFSWSSSINVADIRPEWPQTSLWEEHGQRAHVYYDKVEIPLYIYLQDRKPLTLNLQIQGLACAEMCMPFQHTLSLTLSPPPLLLGAWLKMLGLAFLGGLLLNVMPCVLPVLGLKLRALSQQGPFLFKKICLATALGTFTGFWGLGALIIFFKVVFRHQMGWGAQLQSPYFSAVMALIMVGSAYSLFGLFHLPTPKWVYQQAGQKFSKPLVQAFISGLLAVLLATPCSAPFLGPAVGFALTGSPFEILGFYTAIAAGFSLPYLLGLFLPIDRWLPKPGPWMSKIERSMGVLLFLSAAWLIGWPLSSFLSPFFQTLSWVFLGLWAVVPLLQPLVRPWALWKKQVILYGLPLLTGAIFLSFPALSPEGEAISMVDGHLRWRVWTSQEMQHAFEEGKIIFVDVTGAGCTLCLLNKRIFTLPSLQKLLTSPDVVCMRADYSRGSQEILSFLKRYGRAAIPFNLMISRDHPKGIVLSEILSEEEILKAAEFLKKKQSQRLH